MVTSNLHLLPKVASVGRPRTVIHSAPCSPCPLDDLWRASVQPTSVLMYAALTNVTAGAAACVEGRGPGRTGGGVHPPGRTHTRRRQPHAGPRRKPPRPAPRQQRPRRPHAPVPAAAARRSWRRSLPQGGRQPPARPTRTSGGRRGYAVAATGDVRLSTARPAVDGAQQQTRLRSPTPRRRVRPWRDWLLSAQMPHATLGCQVRPTQLTTTCLSTAHWSSKFWIGLIALDRILRASHRAEPLAKCPREAKPNAHRTDFPPFRVSYADDGQTKIPLFSRRLLCAPDH